MKVEAFTEAYIIYKTQVYKGAVLSKEQDIEILRAFIAGANIVNAGTLINIKETVDKCTSAKTVVHNVLNYLEELDSTLEQIMFGTLPEYIQNDYIQDKMNKKD